MLKVNVHTDFDLQYQEEKFATVSLTKEQAVELIEAQLCKLSYDEGRKFVEKYSK